jgi:hypothetical protein
MKYFFTKYIVIEDLIAELDSLDLSPEEKHHLSGLVDSSLHSAILDEVLSNLNSADKKTFLEKLDKDPENEELTDFLKERIGNIEDKIKKVSDDLVKELHEDVKESKKLR